VGLSANANSLPASVNAYTDNVTFTNTTNGSGNQTRSISLAVVAPATNQAPSVSAGPDSTINISASAALDGTVSDDGLPNPPAALTTTWSKVSGPGTVSFSNPSAVDTSAIFSQPGMYVLRLTANDGALSASDEVTITVNPAPAGSLQFSLSSYSVNENDGNATITVTRTGGSNGAVGVTYTTSNGTAISGQDYTAVVSQVVSFANGDTVSKTVIIPIINDSTFEGNETVNLALSNPTGGATLGSSNTAVLTILEDDPIPSLSIDNVSLNEGHIGTKQFNFTVTLSNSSSQTVTVSYNTSNGTAAGGASCTGGTDYKSLNGMLTFSPGQTTQPISIEVCGDTVPEPNQTFSVSLTSANNATISDGQGVGTILNDDPAVLDNDTFVRQQYLDFLDREADAGGLLFWVTQLNNGLPRANLIEFWVFSLSSG
jgi:Calx-beta domain/Domain of unknown function (DUF4214)